jgi:peptidoglycan/xylan/chitin deacetylase (PgdA/CDA1 family)
MLNCALHGQYTGTVLGDPLRLSLNDCGSREAAWWALAGRVVNLTPDGRRCFLEEMQRVLGVALPTGPTREYAPMTWAQLRELDPAIVEIGAHTRTHAILSRCGAEALHQELVVSKEVIERELGRSIVSFCYPNGQPGDVNDAAVAAVREAGYESAVMACGTFVRRGADRFLLSRMGSPTDWEAFIAESSGLSHVWKRLRSAGASDL